VVERLMRWHERTPARLVFLRGNHEAGWLKVVDGGGWPEFVLPPNNGCWQTVASYDVPGGDDPDRALRVALLTGSFFPKKHLEWMRKLAWFHEDAHAIYVHAGLPKIDGRFVHPAEELGHPDLVWQRDLAFFRDYHGKRVVCGHTATVQLPQELSTYTPDDPTDTWVRDDLIVVDTKCGKRDGYLSAIELPALRIYESR